MVPKYCIITKATNFVQTAFKIRQTLFHSKLVITFNVEMPLKKTSKNWKSR